MKKLLMIMCVLLGTHFSFGQVKTKTKTESQTVEQKAEKRTQKMESELALTADQRGKVYSINLSTAQKRDEVMKNKSLSDTDKKEKVKTIEAERWKQLEPILTKEQKKKLKDKG